MKGARGRYITNRSCPGQPASPASRPDREESMRICKLSLFAILLAGTTRLDAGAGVGGAATIFFGSVTPGPGASFTKFDYFALGSLGTCVTTPGASWSIATLQALAATPNLDPRIYAPLNALLAGPTDGTNVLNGIGFSNG